jgi:ketosteroid isomerase-like protein
MKRYPQAVIIFLVLCHLQSVSIGQHIVRDSVLIKTIDDLNRKIDQAVVAKDLKFLTQHYGEDFVFTHGTGLIDSKKSWLASIQKNKGYASRTHDSTIVELHPDIAIVTGKLTVGRLEPAKDGTTKYSLKYVRVFALRKKNWEMISHRTTSEWHH